MANQKIDGYRELTEAEIKLVNQVKKLGGEFEKIILLLDADKAIDKRWLSIGRTHLQQGLMAITRSITKPTNF